MLKRAPASAGKLLLIAFALTAAPLNAEDGPLEISGETRVRIEGVDGQFRAGRTSDDHLLLIRTSIKAGFDLEDIAIGGELMDSRTYLADAETPLSTSFVNAVELLQFYADVKFDGLLGDDARSRLRLGRQTLHIGSGRQMERPNFANSSPSYSGAHLLTRTLGGDELHLLFVVPVQRLPTERALIEDNAVRFDQEQWNRKIWGVHLRKADIAPVGMPGLGGELFAYGLHESDSDETPTPNRQYVTAGGRLFRAKKAGQVDLDIEGAWRLGQRRATSSALDTTDLDVSAQILFAKVGYTFSGGWQPNLALQYYYVSGDRNPNDARFDQFERLFGSRRTDLGNTSIFGPLTPANLSAPGARIEAVPTPRTDVRLTNSAAFLASDTDSWVIARLRDPTGNSGSFIGHAIDTRMRWRPKATPLEIGLGASVLIYGDFPKNVPGGPAGQQSLYGYTQVTAKF